ncbi:hypothetical protein C2U36_26785, partial [Escherichia coli]
MSNTNSNFEMTGILLGQEVCKRKLLRIIYAIIQQTMDPGMNVSHVAACMVSSPACMSNTNSNFEMTGILLGQEVCKRKLLRIIYAII